MASQGPTTPLPELLATSQQILKQLDGLNQGVTRDLKGDIAGLHFAIGDVKSELTNLETRQRADIDRISNQIRNQAESRLWKIVYLALPIILTAGLGAFISYKQMGTNQTIDAASKKLATRLALTEAFYKRKLAVYEDADKQMAAVVGCLEDLRLNPSDVQERKLAFDNLRTLSDMARTNGLYMTKAVSEGLADVSFTATGMPVLNGKPSSNLKALTDKAAHVEGQMKQELQEFGSLE